MATLVFGSLGTMLGGPLGGAIGSLLGRQVDGALFGPSRQGPRLKDLAVTTSSYGEVLPRHFGRMRVAGSVIWATDLVEHSEGQGTGKGGPTVTAYSYTASFAVALASRPIMDIGRIWADGRLLRGAAGDLKVPGTLRLHRGTGDQPPDPLILAAEGEARCPAHRGIAYAVFEDLDLAAFYNRIPTLTFEVIADTAFDLEDVIGDTIADVDAAVPLAGIVGYTGESTPADDLLAFDRIVPLEIDSDGPRIVIARERRQDAVLALPEPAMAADDDGFGAASGFARRRGAPDKRPPALVRYHDVDRDYQPGLQRATGRPSAGEPIAIDLPAAIDAPTARAIIERAARRIDWSRDRIVWRTAELNRAVAPGTRVALPGIAGQWRVREWEWRTGGVELSLERALPTGADTVSLLGADPGRGNPPDDAAIGETRLVAFELPFDAATGNPDTPRPFAALSSPVASWRGAALHADRGDGALLPLGPAGRRRATIGTARTALAPASPLAIDRGAGVIVALVDPAMQLPSVDTRQLADGANLAVLGGEIIQFLHATLLGDGAWRLSGLLRGRGGTEHAITQHQADESFALLDAGIVALDPAILGTAPGRQVLALGQADAAPVAAPVLLDGLTRRPLTPVHPRRAVTADGGWILSWTRRARGGWPWQDGIDIPLVEQAESYLVTLGAIDAPDALWQTTAPSLAIDAATLTGFAASAPGAALHVRQQGTHALSLPLLLCTLP